MFAQKMAEATSATSFLLWLPSFLSKCQGWSWEHGDGDGDGDDDGDGDGAAVAARWVGS